MGWTGHIGKATDPPEVRFGCDHDWTRCWTRAFRIQASESRDSESWWGDPLIGEFCEHCGQVRMYHPDPEDEAA